VTARALALSSLACAALIAGTALFTSISLGRAVLLAPVLVAGAGAVGFLVVLWTRVAITGLRGTRHPVAIVAAGVLVLLLLVVLSFFVDLPSEQY
jgi:hypothetical protein